MHFYVTPTYRLNIVLDEITTDVVIKITEVITGDVVKNITVSDYYIGHKITIVGLKPNESYTVEATFTDPVTSDVVAVLVEPVTLTPTDPVSLAESVRYLVYDLIADQTIKYNNNIVLDVVEDYEQHKLLEVLNAYNLTAVASIDIQPAYYSELGRLDSGVSLDTLIVPTEIVIKTPDQILATKVLTYFVEQVSDLLRKARIGQNIDIDISEPQHYIEENDGESESQVLAMVVDLTLAIKVYRQNCSM